MFGKKKEISEADQFEELAEVKRQYKGLPEPPLPNAFVIGKTKTIEATMLPQDKSKLLDWVISEFKEQYSGLFSGQDMAKIDADATSLSILFGIYGELRIIRELKQAEQQQGDKNK